MKEYRMFAGIDTSYKGMGTIIINSDFAYCFIIFNDGYWYSTSLCGYE